MSLYSWTPVAESRNRTPTEEKCQAGRWFGSPLDCDEPIAGIFDVTTRAGQEERLRLCAKDAQYIARYAEAFKSE